MRIQTTLYIPVSTPLHTCDARVKIALLFAFTIGVFFVESWWGMALCAIVVLALVVVAQLPVKRLLLLMLPVFVLALFAVVFNVSGALSAGKTAADGFSEGCLVGLRMLLLVLASFVVCFTSTSTELVESFSSLLVPLRGLRVPVDDIALVLAMAIRFIPMIAEEYLRIRDAQASRGAAFEAGPIASRLKAHASVFIPLFVGLFRRADSIALAMDARCYGMASAQATCRTSLERRRFTAKDAFALAVGVAALLLIALAA